MLRKREMPWSRSAGANELRQAQGDLQTTAVPRPNAYLPEDGLPYGQMAPSSPPSRLHDAAYRQAPREIETKGGRGGGVAQDRERRVPAAVAARCLCCACEGNEKRADGPCRELRACQRAFCRRLMSTLSARWGTSVTSSLSEPSAGIGPWRPVAALPVGGVSRDGLHAKSFSDHEQGGRRCTIPNPHVRTRL